IATPVTGSPAAATRPAAAPSSSPGDTNHFCAGGGFPGAAGSQFVCSIDTDCQVCVLGNLAAVGGQCSTNTDCSMPGQTDGVCASGATCQEFAVLAISGTDLYFTGFNVHVQNGTGATDGTVNGRGNLIVGYNEAVYRAPTSPIPYVCDSPSRTGSHNLVLG